MSDKTEFVCLLYPPHGVPRVVEIPAVPLSITAMMSVQRFPNRDLADAALEKFLTENPEYRQWRDGRIESRAQ
jgi:hypothetical protein